MSQSNYIAAAIAIAFLVFITARGSLTKYIDLLTGGSGFGKDTAAAGTTTVEETGKPVSPGSAHDPNEKTEEGKTDAPADGPLSILQSVVKGTIGGQADEILSGVVGAATGSVGPGAVLKVLGGLF